MKKFDKAMSGVVAAILGCAGCAMEPELETSFARTYASFFPAQIDGRDICPFDEVVEVDVFNSSEHAVRVQVELEYIETVTIGQEAVSDPVARRYTTGWTILPRYEPEVVNECRPDAFICIQPIPETDSTQLSFSLSKADIEEAIRQELASIPPVETEEEEATTEEEDPAALGYINITQGWVHFDSQGDPLRTNELRVQIRNACENRTDRLAGTPWLTLSPDADGALAREHDYFSHPQGMTSVPLDANCPDGTETFSMELGLEERRLNAPFWIWGVITRDVYTPESSQRIAVEAHYFEPMRFEGTDADEDGIGDESYEIAMDQVFDQGIQYDPANVQVFMTDGYFTYDADEGWDADRILERGDAPTENVPNDIVTLSEDPAGYENGCE